MNDDQFHSLLEDVRVLDLTDIDGWLCGKILGDMGAEVIKIEEPGGDKGRSFGPFYQNIPHPEKSLTWLAFNTSKKGITLNIESHGGHKIFKKMVKGADIILESFPPGYLDELGLGYFQLSKIKEDIIVTSITPFGQSGPYSQYKASDLICMAMGGVIAINGDPDREPIRYSFPHSHLIASAEAATASIFALYHREVSGEGQHIDQSIQASLVSTLLNTVQWGDMKTIVRPTSIFYQMTPGTEVRTNVIWRCKDGYISFLLLAGSLGARTNYPLIEWMDSEGMASDYLKNIDWDKLSFLELPPEIWRKCADEFSNFFMSHTRAELYEEASKRHFGLFPVNTCEDIMNDRQLKERGFWVELDYPELGRSITHPGTFCKLSEAPLTIGARAPLIGEHNYEIYCGELGISPKEFSVLKSSGVI